MHPSIETEYQQEGAYQRDDDCHNHRSRVEVAKLKQLVQAVIGRRLHVCVENEGESGITQCCEDDLPQWADEYTQRGS